MQDTTRKTLSLSSPRPQRTRSATRPYAGTRPSVPEKPAPELTDVRADSLAYALSGAAQAIAAVLEGTALPQALTDIFTRLQATPQARGAIQDIAYRSMRQLGRTEALLQIMTSKKPEPVLLYGLLCASLTLLMREGDQELAYEPFVVVDQAVSAAASSSHMVFAKGMVNAVLRRFLREQDELMRLVVKQPAARWNYPQWWVDQVRSAYPAQWETILEAGNHQPPMTLRVNQRLTDCDSYQQQLAAAGLESVKIGPSALKLLRPVPVQQIPGFAEGMCSVQDAAAQLAAPLLDVQNGMRVLDACAAPGGKTCHLLELADLDLTALDADAVRLARVHDNLQRLQLKARVQRGDASRSDWWDQRPYDRILADVPCTASGVVRRHPDSRWLRRKTDTAQLAALSARILDNLWRMLAPGGKMLMVTCSVWPAESEVQAAAFAARHQVIRLDAPGQLLPETGKTSDTHNEHDGLFYALFQKPEQS